MGSRSAMEQRSGSRGRYSRQEENHSTEELTNEQKQKLVPEGVEGLVEFRGTTEKVLFELQGGVCSGLTHSGANTISLFQTNAHMWIQSFAGIIEGNPHSIHHIRS